MAESDEIQEKNAFVFGLHKNNLAVSTTASLVNVLTVNLQAVKVGSQVLIHNQGAGDLDYVVLGTYANSALIVAPTGTNDDDDGWVSIAAASIATAGAVADIAISKAFSQIVVRIKHTTLTTPVDVWFRGTNV